MTDSSKTPYVIHKYITDPFEHDVFFGMLLSNVGLDMYVGTFYCIPYARILQQINNKPKIPPLPAPPQAIRSKKTIAAICIQN